MSGDELRERITAILWDEDHRVPGKGESAWARYQRLADALLNEDSPLHLLAKAGERLRKVPTYALTNDGEPLGTVVLADDVLDALNGDERR